MFQPKTFNSIPPGGFYYAQTEGIPRQFKSVPSAENLAKAVSSFRIANHLSRASLAECLEDIGAFTCARLGNNRNYCREISSFAQAFAHHPIVSPPCTTCGTPVN